MKKKNMFIRFLLTEVWVPFILYKGLPWACFFVSILAFTVPNVPSIILWSCGALSLYAGIILVVRLINNKGY